MNTPGQPPYRMPATMIGVTGTNGKTSVTQWIARALGALGKRCAIVGTLGNGFPDALAASPNTTPGAQVLREFLPAAVAAGAEACAMEVSSIGLHQNRVVEIAFDIAVFTNFTRDHLDYHGDMDEYGRQKRRLFDRHTLKAAVVNLDDAFGRVLASQLGGRLEVIGYTLGTADAASAAACRRVLSARQLDDRGRGLAFTLDGVHCQAPVIGRFNASNLLAVVGTLLAAGEALDRIAAVLPQLVSPPGRMQAVPGDDTASEPLVVVDYAHTPDALDHVLTTLRNVATLRGGRLVCVFGCGGERDPGKRPQMGAIAERLADRVVVTSDNPRGEDAQAIVAAILAGMRGTPTVAVDRGCAIATAIATADACDVVLIAGKGHEPYQEIAGVRLPFDDLTVAQAALQRQRLEQPKSASAARHTTRETAC